MVKGFLKELLKTHKTVFSFKELVLLWAADPAIVAARVNYYVKKGDLYHIRRGFYAKDKEYNRLELAVKIYAPSYISFETVLASAGMIFQYYNEIFIASYQSRTILCDGQEYTYKKIQWPILLAAAGIEVKENYSIASPERAFLDILYLNKDYYFDNLSPLNWEKVFEILPIYHNKRMEKIVKKLHQSDKGHNDH